MIIVNNGKDYKISFRSDCIRELRDELENMTWDFVFKHQVIEKEFKKKSISKAWGKCPFGFFVVAKPDKLTVYRKHLNTGYLFNTIEVRKIISFLIIAPNKRDFVAPEKEPDYIHVANEKMYEFKDIHPLIITRQTEPQFQ